MMYLDVEYPYKGVVSVPFDEGAKRRYKLDADEVEILESGNIVWRGDTAFSLTEGSMTDGWDLFERIEATLLQMMTLPEPSTLQRAAVIVKGMGTKVHEELANNMKGSRECVELLNLATKRTGSSGLLLVGILIGLKCAALAASPESDDVSTKDKL